MTPDQMKMMGEHMKGMKEMKGMKGMEGKKGMQ